MINGGLQMIATNVVVVDVNAIGGCLPKQLGTRTVVIVESGVEAELTQPGNLSVSASRTNDPRGTEQPCQLTNHRSDGSGSSRDEDGVTSLHLGGTGQASVGSEPSHSQHTQICRRRGDVGVNDVCITGVKDGMLSPPELVTDVATFRNILAARLDDGTDGTPVKGPVNVERRHIGLDVVHPTTHVRIDRHDVIGNQDLTVG